MTARLRDLIANLESKVEERTRDLAIASDVSRQITLVLDMDLLLPELVEKTRQGFNLYYVALYLYDQQIEELLLEAGTGREGARIKSEAKSIPINARPSVVAQVSRNRKAEIINDTVKSTIYLFEANLPDTRAEAAFPMMIGEELVGVLDLQSETMGRFQESDAMVPRWSASFGPAAPSVRAIRPTAREARRAYWSSGIGEVWLRPVLCR